MVRWALLGALLLGACSKETPGGTDGQAWPDLGHIPPRRDAQAPPRQDRGAPDAAPPSPDLKLVADRSGVDARPCSATGVTTACDPIAASGCSSGVCYLVKGKGPACVCPSGTLASGQSCVSTLECQPGHGCSAGVPTLCRRLCDVRAAKCETNEDCTPVQFHPWGLCLPK
ncbi:MAG: hypothetical protein IT371_21930 [Deltaproteobacteria bacterium]|nr:hypothetical protein [Deltaproteobacteria bacterium]